MLRCSLPLLHFLISLNIMSNGICSMLCQHLISVSSIACRFPSFYFIGFFPMLDFLYGLMENLNWLLIPIKFWRGHPCYVYFFIFSQMLTSGYLRPHYHVSRPYQPYQAKSLFKFVIRLQPQIRTKPVVINLLLKIRYPKTASALIY